DNTGNVAHINAAGRAFAKRMGAGSEDWRQGMMSIEVYDRDGRWVPFDERGLLEAFAGKTVIREQTLVGANGQRMHIHAISAALPGRWDVARIEQVLTNLISNAARYSPAGAEIVLRVRGDEEQVTVDVIDKGAGIPPEQLDKLFTPFFRGAAGQKHKGGLGLG